MIVVFNNPAFIWYDLSIGIDISFYFHILFSLSLSLFVSPRFSSEEISVPISVDSFILCACAFMSYLWLLVGTERQFEVYEKLQEMEAFDSCEAEKGSTAYGITFFDTLVLIFFINDLVFIIDKFQLLLHKF